MGSRPDLYMLVIGALNRLSDCINRDKSEGVRAYSKLIVTQRNVGSTLRWAQRQTPRRTSCLLAQTTRCANNMIGEHAHLGNRMIDRDCSGAWKRADFFCRCTLCFVSCLAGNATNAREFSLAARIRDQNIVHCHKKKRKKNQRNVLQCIMYISAAETRMPFAKSMCHMQCSCAELRLIRPRLAIR